MDKYFVQLHLLEDCNLRCTHCYQQADSHKAVLTIADCKKIFDDIKNYVSKDLEIQINLTGGEPLLHPDLFKIIDMIRAYGWKWALLSNGTMINEAIAFELEKRKPVFVQVSLEGGKEINDSIRGAGSFDNILKGIDILKKTSIKVLVSFTITSKNFREFSKLAKICRQHKVDKLWCDRYVGNDDLKISSEDFMEFLEIQKKEVLRPTFFSKTKIKAERSLQFLLLSDYKSKGKCNYYSCGAGGNLIVICADGVVLPCRRLPIPMGNILEKELKNIIQESQIFNELKHCKIPDACIGCKHRQNCKGGAKCVTYAQTGSFKRRDVNCIKMFN